MSAARPIPRRLLPDECAVRPPLEGGGYGEPRWMRGVRLERAQSACADAHRGADAGAGTLFVDALTTEGAFEIEAGSRVEVGGASLFASHVRRYEAGNGRTHHWEVDLT